MDYKATPVKTDNPSKGTDCVPEGFKVASVPYQRDKEYFFPNHLNRAMVFVSDLPHRTPSGFRRIFQRKDGYVHWVAEGVVVLEKARTKTLWFNVYDTGLTKTGVILGPTCTSLEEASRIADLIPRHDLIGTYSIEVPDAS